MGFRCAYFALDPKYCSFLLVRKKSDLTKLEKKFNLTRRELLESTFPHEVEIKKFF